MSSTIRQAAYGRSSGCLWLCLGGWIYVSLSIIASVIPVTVSGGILLSVGPPLALAGLTFLAGHTRPVAALSVAAGMFYSAIGTASYLVSEDFQRSHPGAIVVTGGFASVVFVLLAIAGALLSLSALLVRRKAAGQG